MPLSPAMSQSKKRALGSAISHETHPLTPLPAPGIPCYTMVEARICDICGYR